MTVLYCWGNTIHGELGLGGIEDEQILTPRRMLWNFNSSVRQIACGGYHTLFLTCDGKVYSCGNNDNGQLGHSKQTKRPRMSSTFKIITELDNHVITKICCGARHTITLNDSGQLHTWGDNEFGQLGLEIPPGIIESPRIVRNLISMAVVQMACGKNHCLVLTSCGRLYSWGSNVYGQLGITEELAHANSPQMVDAIYGIPIASIACGGNHSFMVSKSGAVFGWGRNNCGQLGLNDNINRSLPTQLKTLRSLNVRFIACGDEFSAFLTSDGGVFTCGANTYGQLGHGSNVNEVLPRMVVELMGSTITQLACGTRHTLALVPSRGRMYSFGLGASGQLGTRLTNNASVPQVVLGPWVSPSGCTLIQPNDLQDAEALDVVYEIFSGGDHSIVTTTAFKEKVSPVDSRIYQPHTQILSLTTESSRQCSILDADAIIDLDLLAAFELIFASLSCMNGSFLLADGKHYCCTSRHHGIDFCEASDAFELLRKTEKDSLKQLIWDRVTTELLNAMSTSPPDVEALRIYLILPYYHEFVNAKNYAMLHTPFGNAALRLNNIPRKIISKWWSETPIEWFEHFVHNYKDVVVYIISCKISPNIGGDSQKRIVTFNTHLKTSLDLLSMLYNINHNERQNKLQDESFFWQELSDYVNLEQTYIHWIVDRNPISFNICTYPFLFNAAAKTILLQTDQATQMHHAMQNATSSDILSLLSYGTPISQFLVLNVSRENIVQDTLREILQHNQSDLKKPLKVKFHDEEAEDAGGVRKEFFMLLIRDLLDPKYGMFKEFDECHAVWFADWTFESEDMYFLIGVICGLAIYNFTIINLPFPLALYKKLLGEKVDISDLHDLSPSLAQSMQAVLDYTDDDIIEVLDLRFEISRDNFGELRTDPLKENGDSIQVTLENKKEFVDLYVDFILNKAVKSAFSAFQKGFMKVCWGQVLQLFKPKELMAMVVGNEEYDWHLLELNCEYRNGYTSATPTIKLFWEVFHELSTDDKKKFLLFLTGSDRIPIQGMKAIKIYIQQTADEQFLPVAHTCFNLLDLPPYITKQHLKSKLSLALQQTHGFHLV